MFVWKAIMLLMVSVVIFFICIRINKLLLLSFK
jgi:hypothetical protein